MSKAISQALNMQAAVPMATKKKAILSRLSPPPRHRHLTAAALRSFTHQSSSSSSSPSSAKTNPKTNPKTSSRLTTQEEERKRRNMRRVHQSAEDMGLAWDPELEPEFRGPLWESVAAPSANKNQPEAKKKKKEENLGASAKAVAAEKDKPSSTVKEEMSTTTRMKDRLSMTGSRSRSWPTSSADSGLSVCSGESTSSNSGSGISSISDGCRSLSGGDEYTSQTE